MDVKDLIREFFIKNYAIFTNSHDVYEAEAVSERYEEMLQHYISVVEKNGCKCIKGKKEIIENLEKNKKSDEEYIRYGKFRS